MSIANLKLILIIFGLCQISFAQEDNLYLKVFGKSEKIQRGKARLFWNEADIGEVDVKLKGLKLVSVINKSLHEQLTKVLHKGILDKLKSLNDELNNKDLNNLNINLKYDRSNIAVYLRGPFEYNKQTTLDFAGLRKPEWKSEAQNPNAFSLITNFDLLKEIYHNSERESRSIGTIEHFLNLNSYVIEGVIQYDSSEKHPWIRERTTIVKDLESTKTRIFVGDLTYPLIGQQTLRQVGGFGFSKKFEIGPYEVATPISSKEFVLNEKSFVRIFVNSRLVKSQYFEAGAHKIREIPLSNGLNDIIIEITDSKGQIKILKFKDNTSTELLSVGESLYTFNIGPESEIRENHRYYGPTNDLTFSSFYLRGITDDFTAGAGVQGDEKQWLLDLPLKLASNYGNFSLESSFSKIKENDKTGQSYLLRYDLYTYGKTLLSNRRFSLSATRKTRNFAALGSLNPSNKYPWSFSTIAGGRVLENISTTFGATYSINDNLGEQNPYSFDLTFNINLLKNINLNISAGRGKDDFGKWSDTLFAFLNWSFDESTKFINTYYDRVTNSKRLNYIQQSSEVINAFNSQLSFDEDSSRRQYEAQINYRHSLADFSFGHQQTVNRTNNRSESGKSQFELSTGLVITKDQWALTRPVSGSFAIVKPHEEIKDNRLSLSALSNRKDGQSLWGIPAVITDLRPYYYYQLRLNSDDLQTGISLRSSEFKIRPQYKTGHTLYADIRGLIILQANFKDKNGRPLNLKVATIEALNGKQVKTFFTNREGRGIIEGISYGKYKVHFATTNDHFSITIPKGSKGIVDMGTLKPEGTL